MDKKLVLVLVAVLMIPGALGAVSHEIKVSDGFAQINSSFELTLDDPEKEPVNFWRASWTLPEGAEVIELKDSLGEIEEYDRIRDQIQFKTNSGDPRRSETVTVRYRAPVDIKEWGGIKKVKLSLPGFSGEETSAQLEVPEKLLGTSESPRFVSARETYKANFTGKGPINIQASYTDREGEYSHYIAVGDINLSSADQVYPVLNSFTGRAVDFRKFGVIVLSEEEYEQEVEKWSSGAYKEPGLIFIRKSEADKETITGLVMHEAMHGFNQKPLNWVRSRTALFDEGTAKFIETYVNNRRGVRQAEIFGDAKEWKAACKEEPERTCIYTLKPRGTPEQLWNYYKEGDKFMYGWHPSQPNVRTFGYAYAELLVREYLRKKGGTAFRKVYNRMKDLEPAETTEQYRKNLEDVLGTDLDPCYPLEKEDFDDCLEGVTSYEPKIPESIDIDGEQRKVEFKKVKTPKRSRSLQTTSEGTNFNITVRRAEEQTRDFFRGFLDWIVGQFQKFINLLG